MRTLSLSTFRASLTASLIAVSLVAASCKKDAPAAPVVTAPDPAGHAVLAVPDAGATHLIANTSNFQLPLPTAEDLPGFPIKELPDWPQRQLLAFAQDEFCICGCPHSVQACLKEHTSCKHAKRMMLLAAGQATQGAKAPEMVAELNEYYGSFAAEKRFKPDLSNAGCQGPADAPVTIVEYGDFECPYCAAARIVLEKLVQDANNRVRLCFKVFPLSIHPHSGPAAEAAMYALDHGKFFEMHDLLFENQQALEMVNLKDYASRIGLDADDMAKAIQAEKYSAKISASRAEGEKFNLFTTPGIFINGRPLSGNASPVWSLTPNEEILHFAVDDELEWIANKGHWGTD